MNRSELHNALVAAGWSEDALKLGEMTGFRCEYCGKDFFHSVDDYYSFEVEHIIPRGKTEEKLENLTAVCSTCNFLKRRWDPRDVAGDTATREELISAAQRHIKEQRRQKEEKVARERNLVKLYLAAID